MEYLTLAKHFNNSKLFFSKNELSKILSCYSIGVSKGKWKDYAINFNQNEVNFFIFKNSFSTPDCILTKYKKNKNNKIFFKLEIKNKNNTFYDIDDLITQLIRKSFKLI